MAKKKEKKSETIPGPETGQPDHQEKTTPEESRDPSDPQPRDTAQDLNEQLAEATDKYIRARAELDNYRKRMQRDANEIREYAKNSTVEEFLSVFDHFQMAMDHVHQSPDVETIKQGMQMILAEFKKTLENLGVEKIDAQGREFDPNEHEAVAEEPSEDAPRGIVLRQWKCGYRIGSRLLRPATVIVSSGPPEEEPEAKDNPGRRAGKQETLSQTEKE